MERIVPALDRGNQVMIRYRKIGGIHFATIGRLSVTWSVKHKPRPAPLVLRTPATAPSDRGVLRRIPKWYEADTLANHLEARELRRGIKVICSPYNELED